MTPTEMYDRGTDVLGAAWERALNGNLGVGVPGPIKLAISTVMQPDNQVAQKYALPSQLLLKRVVGASDSRMLTIPGSRASARSFAKNTVASFEDIHARLGSSSRDPYVSNPMRKDRLSDDMTTGAGGEVWVALFMVLEYADGAPELTGELLVETLGRITGWPANFPSPVVPPVEVAIYDLDALAAATSKDPDFLMDIIEVIESPQPQIVFAGPPGTGKTHTALAIAQYLVGDRHRVIQFHASYGYEDFVEGLRPVPVTGGGLEFDVAPGAVRRANFQTGELGRTVLILDEFNRANLPRVLGELLFAMEHRGQKVDLMYTADWVMHPGLVFVATMNTADRSIRSIDAAVRRRFQFFEFQPDASVIAAFYTDGRDNDVPDLVEGFLALNAALESLIDRHHTIGHTFFMRSAGMNPTRLHQVWDRQILPLLEDYLFDAPDELATMTVERFWASLAAP